MTNPAMQPKINHKYRSWQFFLNHMGAYPYAECPKCGEVCQPDGYEEPGEQEHVVREAVRCEECGCKFWYETTTVYRYGGVDED